MRRILSIWLPEFPLERLARAEPGAVPAAAPFALAAAEGSRLIISAANPAAREAGVRPGMGLADARAIAPMLASRPAEPRRDAAALARLARWLVRYGPAFNTDGPDGLWVDITGAGHLFGGEAALAADLKRRLARFGLTAELGIGHGLGMAWALARFHLAKSLLAPGDSPPGSRPPGAGINNDALKEELFDSAKATIACARRLPSGEPAAGRGISNGELKERVFNSPKATAAGGRLPACADEAASARRRPERESPAASKDSSFLPDLPVEALRIDGETAQLLRRLGLKRIGQLHGLPRAAIERRFRARLDPVLRRLDQVRGLRPEPLKPMRVPPRHSVRAAFAEPLIADEGLQAALAGLASDLCTGLAATRRGARKLLLTLHRSDGSRAAIRAGLSRPSRSAPHMLRLLREKLAAIDAGFGIDLMQLDAPRTEPLTPSQEGLAGGGETGETANEALAAFIDRLTGRLGPAKVLRLEPKPSHLPERKESLLAASQSFIAPHNSVAAPHPNPLPAKARGEGIERSRSGDHPPRVEGSMLCGSSLALPAPGGRLPERESPGAKKNPPLLLPNPELISVIAAAPEGPPELMRWRRTLSRIVRAEGPERIAPEWWREIGAPPSRSRDYYVVEDETGARFWLFRDGRHDETQENETGGGDARRPDWYLHGVFG